jgi:hypothetical protein
MALPLMLCGNDKWNSGDMDSFGCNQSSCASLEHSTNRAPETVKKVPRTMCKCNRLWGETSCLYGSSATQLGLAAAGIGALVVLFGIGLPVLN